MVPGSGSAFRVSGSGNLRARIPGIEAEKAEKGPGDTRNGPELGDFPMAGACAGFSRTITQKKI